MNRGIVKPRFFGREFPKNRGFLEKRHAQNLQDFAHRPLHLQFLANDGHQHIDANRDPYRQPTPRSAFSRVFSLPQSRREAAVIESDGYNDRENCSLRLYIILHIYKLEYNSRMEGPSECRVRPPLPMLPGPVSVTAPHSLIRVPPGTVAAHHPFGSAAEGFPLFPEDKSVRWHADRPHRDASGRGPEIRLETARLIGWNCSNDVTYMRELRTKQVESSSIDE